MDEKKTFKISKKMRRIIALVLCLTLVGSCGAVLYNRISDNKKVSEEIGIDGWDTPGGSAQSIELQDTEYDMFIIPDKYNCGAKGELTPVHPNDTVNGVFFKASGDPTIISLGFYYKNTDISGEVVFENLDFSGYTLMMTNEGDVDRNIHLVFNNCKFGIIKNNADAGLMSYSYNNCTITQAQGSNSDFYRCLFGDSYWDCMNPNKCVHVTECYFRNVVAYDPAGNGKHSDGVQIYGKAGVPIEDISFTRCRFETPSVTPSGSSGRVNACITVLLEYSSADGITFDDCIVNGGGYTIYATSKYAECTLTNVNFNNISIGEAHLFNDIYPTVGDGVSFNNIVDTKNLYVSSVWFDGTSTHFITTNDTCTERKLLIYADGQTYQFTIPACLGGKDLRYGYVDYPFEDFPFDVDITVPGDVTYAACFDNTNGEYKQIRNINNTGETRFFIPEEEAEEELFLDFDSFFTGEVVSEAADSSLIGIAPEVEYSQEQPVGSGEISINVIDNSDASPVISGSCGKNAEYCLYNNGNLVISGLGAMNSYITTTPAPWTDFKNLITSITVEEGITSVGNQAFRELTSAKSVSLPSTLKTIGSNSFSKCSSLTRVSMYAGVTDIAERAFGTSAVKEVLFYGTADEWNSMNIADYNDKLLSATVFFVTEVEEPVEEVVERAVLYSGACGDNAEFVLYEDGVLSIIGSGATYNYTGIKTAPWYSYADQITGIEIAEGITKIGTQNFRKLKNVQSVEIPSTVTIIGANAFISCSSLNTVVIPASVKQIDRYAFSGTKLTSVIFNGSSAEWNSITIGTFNGNLESCVTFTK